MNLSTHLLRVSYSLSALLFHFSYLIALLSLLVNAINLQLFFNFFSFFYSLLSFYLFFFFFLNDPAPPEISPLPLHDALPICATPRAPPAPRTRAIPVREGFGGVMRAGSTLGKIPGDRSGPGRSCALPRPCRSLRGTRHVRSEEHTSELQSQSNLVCRLLLEKK